MSDPAWTRTFLSAAGDCYNRLVGEGIDLSAYNLEEMAADVEDLRRALGVNEWNLMTSSSSSRIALRSWTGTRTMCDRRPWIRPSSPGTAASVERTTLPGRLWRC